MKAQYVRELAEGQRVDSVFVVCSKEMRSTRAGEAYLSLELGDRTGRIPAVWFRPSIGTAASVPAGVVARASGTVTTFRGTKRISVDGLVPAREYDAGDMLASGHREIAEMVTQFRSLASGVKDLALRALLRAVFGDTEFFERFSQCPGSQSHHHAYLGGLIEHTINVATICRSAESIYQEVDGDLLVTAALLHDIGKVDELQWGTSIEYTDAGRLLGHVVLGERHLSRCAARARPSLAGSRLLRLSHVLLSHHGELEWGSPKRPSTVEALLLHHADNLDAKVGGFVSLVSGSAVAQESWTDSHNHFRRPLYVPVPAEDDRPMRTSEDAQYARASA